MLKCVLSKNAEDILRKLVGKKLLQFYCIKAGVELHSTLKVHSGKKILIVVQSKAKDYYLITIDFDQHLYKINEDSLVDIVLEEVEFPIVDTDTYCCTFAPFENPLRIEKIFISNNQGKTAEYLELVYFNSIIFRMEGGKYVNIMRGEAPGSFHVTFDEDDTKTIRSESFELVEINI